MAEEKTRAERFLEAFNNIDYSLRVRYGLNRSMSFSDLIRKSVVLNYIVRKYEDDLIDYSRLRNAIIHQGSMEKIIAEPHEDVVDKIEKIERLINTPPKALDTVSRRDVLTVDISETIGNVIKLIASSGYSNIPVIDNGGIVGIANGQKILNVFGQELINGKTAESFLSEPIEKVISTLFSSAYFVIKDENITVEFTYNSQKKIPIYSKLNERFEEICNKFALKINKDISKIQFIYSGKDINTNNKLITLAEIINKIDNERKMMSIIALDISNESTIINKKNIIKANQVICPRCQESARINFENFQIKIYDCKNQHTSYLYIFNFILRYMYKLKNNKC